MNRLGNDEYFRALETYKTLKNATEEEYLPADIIYMIDKEIRLKFRRDKEIVSKGSNDQGLSSTNPHNIKKQTSGEKPSYEEWVRKKQFETKIKKSLMMRALKNKYENDLLVEQDKEEKDSEKRKRLREWEAHKMYETSRKVLGERTSKIEKEHQRQIKRKEAEDHYREWLKGNMTKLKEEKKLNKLKKIKEQEEKKKKEEADALFKQKAEENFKKWLKSKKKITTPRSRNQRKIKIKKPIMLAYSPNKKHLKDSSYRLEVGSFNGSEGSSISERDYVRQISSKPKLYQKYDDLSSIKLSQLNKDVVESSSGDYEEDIEHNEYQHYEEEDEEDDEEGEEEEKEEEEEEEDEEEEYEDEDEEEDEEGIEDYQDYQDSDSGFDHVGHLSF